MTTWLLRGLAFAALMIVDRLIQGPLINKWVSAAGVINLALLTLFVVLPALAWGYLDGRQEAKATPDPDRRKDLAMMWLVSGLVAGLVGGLVAYLLSLTPLAIYSGGVFQELTAFAAFTTLVVFVSAMIGVVVGQKLVDRQYAKLPVHHHGLAAEGYADQQHFHAATVFDAVNGGHEAAAAEAGAAGTATLTAPTPTAEDATVEIPLPAQERPEETTTEIPLPESSAETTEIGTPEAETTEIATPEAETTEIGQPDQRSDGKDG